ncbi:sigma-70 family RNA polymerase sigma factor [Streptomyces sp. NBC_01353]|uniref:sigma-70 family RNA polymerase sigma factor n=1 Tax=Streptomyces sp. NBC_01353 TaxID=2903835 RepID=UPI002E360667|nr:sigma-70 family RNA polymerase sigma factor [Streptomyces sp. NBC_01353]
MHSDERGTAALVDAAVAGDPHAGERLIRAYLPLVYNIVGRALDGHADVDDVVQETMFRALDGLPGLRDPERFRSWLVAIAMNQIRRRWRERQAGPVPGLDRATELADPAGDFVDLTILRLGLSGQRREVAEATRWLDESDRDLLALWWLEAGGELSRAELADALAVPAAHAAVRVQRMKERLETGRAVVRALATRPPCTELLDVTVGWDGHPAPIWRKRIARHVTTCAPCGRTRSGLAPAEGLLVGLGLVPPLLAWGAARPDIQTAAWAGQSPDTGAGGDWGAGQAGSPGSDWGMGQAGPGPELAPYGGAPADPGAAGSSAGQVSGGDPYLDFEPGSGLAGDGLGSVSGGGGGGFGEAGPSAPAPGAGREGSGLRRSVVAGVVAVGVLGGLILLVPSDPETRQPAPRTPAAAPPPAPSTVRASTAAPRPRPTSATPTPTPTPTPTAEERLTRLVNQRRVEAGCAPLRQDPRLTEAARDYARDMVRRGYYAHSSPEGEFADARISSAGYTWSAWAENLARGGSDPSVVFESWMDGAMHQENMLNCRYKHTGVAAVSGPDGMVWVQKLASPAS